MSGSANQRTMRYLHASGERSVVETIFRSPGQSGKQVEQTQMRRQTSLARSPLGQRGASITPGPVKARAQPWVRETVVPSYAADPDALLAVARHRDVSPADSGAMADGLNPFAISHTAKTISCTKMGKASTSWVVEKFSMRWNMTRRAESMTNGMATRPQADSHRGTSRD